MEATKRIPHHTMNGSSIFRDQIGVYHLLDTKKFRHHYETASWYKDIEVPAGDYPVYLENDQYHSRYHALAFLSGIVVGSLFVNRLFQFSSVHRDEKVGEEDTYVLSWRTNEVAKAADEGEITLDDGWTVEGEIRESDYDGREWVSYSLIGPDGKKR